MASYPQVTKYIPQKPEKYVGNPRNIESRSSWEKKFMIWCDTNPSVLYWSSEPFGIPYFSQIDGEQHRYFIDFIVKIKDKEGKEKTLLVEIKPSCQCIPPVRGKKRIKTYLKECQTYQINMNKWEAAQKFAELNNMEFVVLDEHSLGIKNGKNV